MIFSTATTTTKKTKNRRSRRTHRLTPVLRMYDVARELGFPVSTDIPTEVLELMTLYPQPVRPQGGGVEYLPTPRQREIGTRGS